MLFFILLASIIFFDDRGGDGGGGGLLLDSGTHHLFRFISRRAISEPLGRLEPCLVERSCLYIVYIYYRRPVWLTQEANVYNVYYCSMMTLRCYLQRVKTNDLGLPCQGRHGTALTC